MQKQMWEYICFEPSRYKIQVDIKEIYKIFLILFCFGKVVIFN